jgi:hypothetical protein
MIVNSTKNAYITTDGTTYSSVANTTLSSAPNQLMYANGRWIASMNGQACYSTNNGTSWSSAIATGGSGPIYYNGSFFLITASDIQKSTDGSSWSSMPYTGDTYSPSGSPLFPNLSMAAQYKASGSGTIVVLAWKDAIRYTNNNGSTWTQVTVATAPGTGSNLNWNKVTWDKDVGFLLTDDYGNALHSTDGTSWGPRTIPNVTGSGFIYGNNAPINPISNMANSTANSVMSKASKWTISGRSLSFGSNNFFMNNTWTGVSASNAIAIAGKLWIVFVDAALSISAAFYDRIASYYREMTASPITFSDKIFLTSITSNASVTSSSILSFVNKIWKKPWSIIYAASKWVGVKNNTAVAATSTDGATWTTRTLPTTSFWSGIAHNGTIFAALSTDGKAATSTDGATWTTRTLPNTNAYHAIVAGGSTFVGIASNSNKCITSTDGITWTERSMPTAAGWNAISRNGSVFCAITNSNVCATSSDGITWTQHYMPDNINYTSITWALGQFTAVAAGPTNLAATSSDGVNWNRIYMPQSANWTGVGPGVGIPNV